LTSEGRLDDLPMDVQAARLTIVAEQALIRFGLADNSELTLHRLGENAIFRVKDHAQGYEFALRVHRPNYRTDAEIRSELAWLDALRSEGQVTPAPHAGVDGDLLQVIPKVPGISEPRQCDVLSWIDGIPLRKVDPETALPLLGRTMARLHLHGRVWRPPSWFRRPTMDEGGLVGDAPVIGDYRKIPLKIDERALFDGAAEAVRAQLARYPKTADTWGLIHSDFLDNNLLFAGGQAVMIDFDDASWGWYAYDLGTLRYRGKALIDEVGWLQLFLSGYEPLRHLSGIDLAMLPAFLAARALGMVGWMHGRGVRADKYRQLIVDDGILRCSALLATLKS
jgi:Ser/Thr protein kinase RdoA (MazF antagonist)